MNILTQLKESNWTEWILIAIFIVVGIFISPLIFMCLLAEAISRLFGVSIMEIILEIILGPDPEEDNY